MKRFSALALSVFLGSFAQAKETFTVTDTSSMPFSFYVGAGLDLGANFLDYTLNLDGITNQITTTFPGSEQETYQADIGKAFFKMKNQNALNFGGRLFVGTLSDLGNNFEFESRLTVGTQFNNPELTTDYKLADSNKPSDDSLELELKQENSTVDSIDNEEDEADATYNYQVSISTKNPKGIIVDTKETPTDIYKEGAFMPDSDFKALMGTKNLKVKENIDGQAYNKRITDDFNTRVTNRIGAIAQAAVDAAAKSSNIALTDAAKSSLVTAYSNQSDPFNPIAFYRYNIINGTPDSLKVTTIPGLVNTLPGGVQLTTNDDITSYGVIVNSSTPGSSDMIKNMNTNLDANGVSYRTNVDKSAAVADTTQFVTFTANTTSRTATIASNVTPMLKVAVNSAGVTDKTADVNSAVKTFLGDQSYDPLAALNRTIGKSVEVNKSAVTSINNVNYNVNNNSIYLPTSTDSVTDVTNQFAKGGSIIDSNNQVYQITESPDKAADRVSSPGNVKMNVYDASTVANLLSGTAKATDYDSKYSLSDADLDYSDALSTERVTASIKVREMWKADIVGGLNYKVPGTAMYFGLSVGAGMRGYDAKITENRKILNAPSAIAVSYLQSTGEAKLVTVSDDDKYTASTFDPLTFVGGDYTNHQLALEMAEAKSMPEGFAFTHESSVSDANGVIGRPASASVTETTNTRSAHLLRGHGSVGVKVGYEMMSNLRLELGAKYEFSLTDDKATSLALSSTPASSNNTSTTTDSPNNISVGAAKIGGELSLIYLIA